MCLLTPMQQLDTRGLFDGAAESKEASCRLSLLLSKPDLLYLPRLDLQLGLCHCLFILRLKSQDANMLFPLKFESLSGNEVLVGPALIPWPLLCLLS